MLTSAGGADERGLRDRAVLLLTCRLELRASEVSWLSLDDISWHTGIITARRKGGGVRSFRCPAMPARRSPVTCQPVRGAQHTGSVRHRDGATPPADA